MQTSGPALSVSGSLLLVFTCWIRLPPVSPPGPTPFDRDAPRLRERLRSPRRPSHAAFDERPGSISPSRAAPASTNVRLTEPTLASDATVTVGGVRQTLSSRFDCVDGCRRCENGRRAADVVVTSGGAFGDALEGVHVRGPERRRQPPRRDRYSMSAPLRRSHLDSPIRTETVTLIATVSDADIDELIGVRGPARNVSATEPITIWHLPATVTPSTA